MHPARRAVLVTVRPAVVRVARVERLVLVVREQLEFIQAFGERFSDAARFS